MREEYFILIKMVKMKNCRHLWPRHDIPLSKAWRGERPRPPVPQLALPPAAIIGARRSSLAPSAADEAAAAAAAAAPPPPHATPLTLPPLSLSLL